MDQMFLLRGGTEMKKDFGKRLLSLMLSVLMVIGIMPMSVFAAQENAFILVAEAGGNLVVAPEYIYYTEEQTVRQALMASRHEFVGIEDDWITAIDGVTGNFKRSDEDGNFALNDPASEVEFYRFSEEENSQPSEGLKQLMTAMADYALKPADVKAAAKEEYDIAYASFVGIDSASAAVLADNINAAVKAYEDSQSGGAFAVTFTDGVNVHAGATITAENAYGKIWSDEDGDGVPDILIYGYAVAGDTGGYIKGNRVDLFYDTLATCIDFGRKNARVYILEE